MRINNNIMAYNAHRQLKVNASAQENPWRNCHQATELTELVTMRQVCPYPKK